MLSRRALLAFGLSLLGLALSPHAEAASYPDKPIRFICTSAAGSPLDTMMRALAKGLGDQLGQTVVVENRPGGTGAVGMANAMNAPADGYTVISATGSTSFLMADEKSQFQPADFIFVRALQTEASSVAVPRNSPYRTLADLVKALQQTPDKVNIGGYATAGFHQYVLYRLQEAAGLKAVWVPFNGGNQAVLALMGGHLDAAVITPSSATSQIRSGDLRLLGISTDQRDEFFPEVPTIKEQGWNVVETLWRGVMVRAGTPPEVVAKLADAIKAVEKTPEWKSFMHANMQSSMDLDVPALKTFVEDEVRTRRDFLKTLGSK